MSAWLKSSPAPTSDAFAALASADQVVAFDLLAVFLGDALEAIRSAHVKETSAADEEGDDQRDAA